MYIRMLHDDAREETGICLTYYYYHILKQFLYGRRDSPRGRI